MSYGQDNTGGNRQVHPKEEGFSMGNVEPKTLHIGNLDVAVNEEFLSTLFGQMGQVEKTKVFYGAETHALVELVDHTTAVKVMQSMNGRVLLNMEMKVKWAVEPGQSQPPQVKIDTSKHFHVFVGDLPHDIETATLKEAFAPFGEISDAKVIRDVSSMKSKGYGFVSFPKRENAETAIEQMNGHCLGGRAIRTNWASRKPNQERSDGFSSGGSWANDRGNHDVYSSTSEGNTSVYVGNLAAAVSEEDIRSAFERFGRIEDVRFFKMHHYAFIRFETKDAAARAILQMNGGELGGSTIRCSWGKGGRDGGYGGGQHGYGAGRGGFGRPGAGGPPGAGATQNVQQQYWHQYYAQYYNNPQVMQQWANYWQNQQQQSGASSSSASGSNSSEK